MMKIKWNKIKAAQRNQIKKQNRWNGIQPISATDTSADERNMNELRNKNDSDDDNKKKDTKGTNEHPNTKRKKNEAKTNKFVFFFNLALLLFACPARCRVDVWI